MDTDTPAPDTQPLAFITGDESEISPALRELLQPGNALRLFFYEGNHQNKLLHIRGIVDGLVVFRWWDVGRQNWQYSIEPAYWFSLYMENGYLTSKGKSDG